MGFSKKLFVFAFFISEISFAAQAPPQSHATEAPRPVGRSEIIDSTSFPNAPYESHSILVAPNRVELQIERVRPAGQPGREAYFLMVLIDGKIQSGSYEGDDKDALQRAKSLKLKLAHEVHGANLKGKQIAVVGGGKKSPCSPRITWESPATLT